MTLALHAFAYIIATAGFLEGSAMIARVLV